MDDVAAFRQTEIDGINGYHLHYYYYLYFILKMGNKKDSFFLLSVTLRPCSSHHPSISADSRRNPMQITRGPS